ncbi:MAG: hypothetical protein RL748_3498 [Pseudomonadota bacterium]|jgi:uncharacterized protein (TIGR00290 family)
MMALVLHHGHFCLNTGFFSRIGFIWPFRFYIPSIIMKKPTLLSWSSGKDSAWALYQLQQDPLIDLRGLFCTVNQEFSRVAMHGVRLDLLQQQAQALGLPLEVIEIPWPCSNEAYGEIMSAFVGRAKAAGIKQFAFGDLFLEDIRRYREEKLAGSGIEPIFPLWNSKTPELAQQMIAGGLRTVITCLDPKTMPVELAGHEFNQTFLDALPAGADPCGENGEFHSFAFDGPMFRHRVALQAGEVVTRDGYVFADFLPTTAQ